jgi:putative hydrolase of HD superfamily
MELSGDRLFETLLKIYDIKDQIRSGWELRDVEYPESVADHSWGTGFLTLLFSNGAGIDRGRALAIAAVHDLAEAEIGDIPTRVFLEERSVSKEEKRILEAEAMGKIGEGLDSEEVHDLWREYESATTIEARFVRDMNLIDMCLQAYKYEKEKRYSNNRDNPNFKNFDKLDEFFATAKPRFCTEIGKRLFEEIYSRYSEITAFDPGN